MKMHQLQYAAARFPVWQKFATASKANSRTCSELSRTGHFQGLEIAIHTLTTEFRDFQG